MEFYGNLSTFYFSVMVVFFAICEMLSVLIQELSIESYILQWPPNVLFGHLGHI